MISLISMSDELTVYTNSSSAIVHWQGNTMSSQGAGQSLNAPATNLTKSNVQKLNKKKTLANFMNYYMQTIQLYNQNISVNIINKHK